MLPIVSEAQEGKRDFKIYMGKVATNLEFKAGLYRVIFPATDIRFSYI